MTLFKKAPDGAISGRSRLFGLLMADSGRYNRRFSVNSTAFSLIPDNNIGIKTFIELQIIIINSFKRHLTPRRKGAKDGRRESTTKARRHEGKKSLKHRGTE
ncbi:MAG: hypothetical protein COA78_04220 [Blastopirellula sp.]|nr:MAG: hypothetical protein COA78_04220 [Blastopirellula sp.]